MDIILIESVAKLGKVGERVIVKDGYGRNYLLPQKKALRATADNIAYFEAKKAEIEADNQKLVEKAQAVEAKIAGTHLVLIRQGSEDGRLYGSVSSKDIVDALKDKTGVEILRRQVDLNEAIKSIGIYALDIILHGDVVAKIEINVARSEGEAEDARIEAKEGPKKPKTDEYDAAHQAASEDTPPADPAAEGSEEEAA